MPNIEIDLLREYNELQNKIFVSEGSEVMIKKALQTIKFEIDKKGGKVKSEAIITTEATAIMDEPDAKMPRHFYLDDSFVMFLIEEGKENPYYATKITDITKKKKYI